MKDGIIVVNKPKEYTSRDVVNKICKILNTRKVGHAGTLDPLATGVLVVAINMGLKTLEFLENSTKEYIAKVKLGIKTDTLDVTGNVLEEKHDFSLDKRALESILLSFKGTYMQEVPLYSSVRVNGKRLYKYAREKEEVNLPKREVTIFDISLLSFDSLSFSFKVKVSKGTYIRSLIRDIGDKLGIPCSMEELERVKQGSFSIEDSNTLEDIEKGNYKMMPMLKVFENYFVVTADAYLENMILNGRILENRYDQDLVVFKSESDNVLAIYEVYDKDNTKIKPLKVFKDNA